MNPVKYWALVLFYASWAVTSAFAVYLKDPALFQSSGALGIASAIMLFGYQKSRLAHMMSVAHAQDFDLLARETDVRIDGLTAQVNLNTVMLKKNVSLSDAASKQIDDKVEQVEGRIAALKPKLAEIDAGLVAHREASAALKAMGAKAQTSTTGREIAVVALATIQTGFGERILRALLGV